MLTYSCSKCGMKLKHDEMYIHLLRDCQRKLKGK